MNEWIDQLKLLLGIEDSGSDGLLSTLLSQAESAILDCTNRTKTIERLEPIVVDYAVVLYNRRGTEGEISRSEGGVSHSFFDGIPEEIMRRLNPYKRARVVGYAPETK